MSKSFKEMYQRDWRWWTSVGIVALAGLLLGIFNASLWVALLTVAVVSMVCVPWIMIPKIKAGEYDKT